MKKSLLFLLLFSVALFVQAQSADRINARINKLDEALNLTESQKVQLYEIFTEYSGKNKVDGTTIRSMNEEERATFKAERKTSRAALDEAVAAVLSPTQLTTYNELKKERRNATKRKMKQERRADFEKKAARMSEKLNLTAQQEVEVRAIFQKHLVAKGDGKQLSEMSQAEKTAFRENRKAAQIAVDADLQEVLTTEQYAIYKAEQAKHMEKRQEKRATNKDARFRQRLDKLDSELNLSPLQKSQVEALLANQMENASSIRGDKAARKAAKAAFDEEMKTILTPEQYTAFQSLQAEQKKRMRRNRR